MPTICIYAEKIGREDHPTSTGMLGRLSQRFRNTVDLALWKTFGTLPIRQVNADGAALSESVEALFHQHAGSRLDIVDLPWGQLDDAAIELINESCDLFVVAGPYLALDDEGRLPPHLQADHAAFRRIRIPIVGLGLGVTRPTAGRFPQSPHLSPEAAARLRDIANRMTQISVRDHATARLIEEIAGRRPLLVPPPALAVGHGISVPPRPARREAPHIGLDLSLQGAEAGAIFRLNLPRYVELARMLVARHGEPLVCFSHHEADQVFPRLLASEGIAVRTVTGRPDAVLAEYAKLDVHICQTAHSAAAAMSAGVPTLGLSDDQATFGFFDLMEMGRYCLPILPLDVGHVLGLIDELIKDRESLSRCLDARRRDLSQMLDHAISRSLAGLDTATGRAGDPMHPFASQRERATEAS